MQLLGGKFKYTQKLQAVLMESEKLYSLELTHTHSFFILTALHKKNKPTKLTPQELNTKAYQQ